jgi:hypothetical protein
MKLLPGHVTVAIWYVMIQTVSRNVTVIWCVMVQTVSRTRECDDTRISRKSDLRTGEMCEKDVINKKRTGQVSVYWTDA